MRKWWSSEYKYKGNIYLRNARNNWNYCILLDMIILKKFSEIFLFKIYNISSFQIRIYFKFIILNII